MKELSLREIQLAELEILSEFDRICKENGLRYSIIAGTLLGAVRHKGFIPWDDDIDVGMPRSDYEKFAEIFNSCKSADNFYLHEKSDNSIYPFMKMVDTNITLNWNGLAEVEHLWVDIFPEDGFPSNDKIMKKSLKKADFYRKVIGFSRWKNIKEYIGRHNKITAWLISKFVKIYGCERALRKLNKLASKYKYENSEFVGLMVWGQYGTGERMLKKEFEHMEEVEFEGRKFSAMGCWDSYLHGIYGDYMVLPPEDKRVTHRIKAYREDK